MQLNTSAVSHLRRWVSSASGTHARHAGSQRLDGLGVFGPVWAIATLFSLAGDHQVLLWRQGAMPSVLAWATLLAAFALLARPNGTRWLFALAALAALRYVEALPVASNNKTISVFMNAAIVLVVVQAAWTARGDDLREIVYERLRVVARALLAVMYFYGIFHKINTDFLDPAVSCAVALYKPLASPFGLEEQLLGHHLAIWTTFVVEAITLVALYWRRWFAVGLILGLAFHFVIPISAYSWYMDFSSLVLALYILAIPREVGAECYARLQTLLQTLRGHAKGGLVLLGALASLTAVVAIVSAYGPYKGVHVFHSIMLLLWALYGGVMMVLLTEAALPHLPWTGQRGPRQPLWVYGVPCVLFVSCLSPYLGLKTESSIAMFSNLHTEGGVTNHLMFAEPPYLFDYQDEVVELVASSHPAIEALARRGQHMVMFSLREHMRWLPDHWVTYRQGGKLHERVNAASFDPADLAGRLERKLLLFKPVDFTRPKPCTH